MFRLATCDFKGRRVLLVEDDQQTARMVASSIVDGGGSVVGITPTVDGAVQIAKAVPIDLVFLHIRYAGGSALPIGEIFRPLGIPGEFMACFDDWIEFADHHDGHEFRVLAEG